jgi:hypothetical protein
MVFLYCLIARTLSINAMILVLIIGFMLTRDKYHIKPKIEKTTVVEGQ